MAFRVLFQQTNKQTNKCDPETELGSHCQTDMPYHNFIPPDQHDQDWALLRGMVITLIDEVKNSDTPTVLSNFQDQRIADREIKIIKIYGGLALFPFPGTRNLSTSGVEVLCIF